MKQSDSGESEREKTMESLDDVGKEEVKKEGGS